MNDRPIKPYLLISFNYLKRKVVARLNIVATTDRIFEYAHHGNVKDHTAKEV